MRSLYKLRSHTVRMDPCTAKIFSTYLFIYLKGSGVGKNRLDMSEILFDDIELSYSQSLKYRCLQKGVHFAKKNRSTTFF